MNTDLFRCRWETILSRLIVLQIIVTMFIVACNPLAQQFPDDILCLVSYVGSPSEVPYGIIGTLVDFTWLSDSKRIVYQDTLGQKYVVDVEGLNRGKARILTKLIGYGVNISPDDRLISVTDSTIGGNLLLDSVVKIYDLHTGGILFSIPNASNSFWSPDGSTLAMNSYKKQGGSTRSSIVLVNVQDAGEPSILVQPGWGSYHVGPWSANGKHLAVTKSDAQTDKLLIANVDTGETQQLPSLEECQRMPMWSPTASRLAYIGSNPDGNWDILVLELEGNNVVNLTNTPDSDEYQPSWSPDGRYIAYVAFKPTSKTTFEQDIYLVDTSSNEVRRLTNTPDEHESLPLWSPNGDKIAYLSVIDDTWYLNLINPDGSGQERLATIGSE